MLRQRKGAPQGRKASESGLKWRRTDLADLDDVGLKRLYQKELPAEVFRVDLQKALAYFVLDSALLCSGTWMFSPTIRLCQTFVGQFFGWLAGIITFSMFYGLVMTSMYAIGCDCLHGIFADSPHMNEIIGRFCFTPLLIPFTSFQRRNVIRHKTINRVDQEDAMGISFFLSAMTIYSKPFPYVRKATVVLVATIEHLLRQEMLPIGNVPRVAHRTHALADYMAQVHLENALIAGFLFFVVLSYGVQGLAIYFCCYINFAWWIYTDTYMSRLKGLKEVTVNNRKVLAINKPHEFDRQVWKFGKGVFHVHDHDYGAVINHLRHHYNDCAAVRHILFGEVPHYNLVQAKKFILAHEALRYGDTSHHSNIFVDFWRIYDALGDSSTLHELSVEGILSKPKRRDVKGLYSALEVESRNDKKWQADVARRKSNPLSLSFSGGWVYPDTFGTTQRRGTGLEATSFFNSQSADKRNKGKFLDLQQILERQED